MKKLCITLLVILIIIIFISQCQTFGKANRTIRIDPPTPVDEYQAMIILGHHNFNYNAAQQDGSDIRVFDTEGNNLNFWIENWNPYGISIVWVRVPEAGTEKIVIKSGDPGVIPGSDGTKVFDPINWDTLRTRWLYSGTIPGRVSGWEYPLTEFDLEVADWIPVDIDTDYTEDCKHCRWFVRKEVFIAQGEVTFSGEADDDVVWSLVGSDELYRKIGGNEEDSDGKNPGSFIGNIVLDEPFGHFIWAGRGQEGIDDEMLKLMRIDSGIERIFTRKTVDRSALEKPDEERGEGLDEGTEETTTEVGTEDMEDKGSD